MFSRRLARSRSAAKQQGSAALAPELRWVPPPTQAIYRVGYGVDPFATRPWGQALEDGTFGNRFDDPGALFGIPPEERFRMIYCAADLAGAFGEVISRLRPDIELLTRLNAIDDDEPLELMLDGIVDPEDPRRGLVSREWQFKRRIGRTYLDPSLRFVDLRSTTNLTILRTELAPFLASMGISDVDISTVAGSTRPFTQALARYVYEQVNEEGGGLFAGIRYMSRLNPDWECWAVFDTRTIDKRGPSETIHPDNPGLMEAARLLRLTIEGVASGHHIRP